MTTADDDILQAFIDESREHLDGVENDLLAIEAAGAAADLDLVNTVFRGVHSIKGSAGFLGLERITDVAHAMEGILNQVRNQQLVVDAQDTSILLEAADLLKEMVADPAGSTGRDTAPILSALATIKGSTGDSPFTAEPRPRTEDPGDAQPKEGGLDLFTGLAQEAERALEQTEFLFLLRLEAQHLEGAGRGRDEILADLAQTGVVVAARNVGPQVTLVLFATVLDVEIVAEMVGLEAGRIRSVHPLDLAQAQIPPSTGQGTESASSRDTGPLPAAPVAPAEPAGPAVPGPQRRASQPQAVGGPAPESSLRVHVELLDKLMNLAGELVLTRNQLLQLTATAQDSALLQAASRLDHVTTEVQETIVSTRMQPVGQVFSRFRRVVRDLSRTLGKDVELEIEGEGVELDKTIIEALSDPLAHLVRNSMDHGIETPEERQAADKPGPARLRLAAYHEAGQVVIEVVDDGRGIDPARIRAKAIASTAFDRGHVETMSDKEVIRLVFRPGFSTAEQVTEVSGRGVGMDVVHTNLTRLGGTIDLDSVVGVGTTVRVKLPLTLAIIPSLLVAVETERYAIPQVNLVRLVRIPANQVDDRMEQINGARVLRLGEELVPVVALGSILGMDGGDHHRTGSRDGSVSVAVLAAGKLRFGLLVDDLLDSEEIVVKPLDRYLSGTGIYAGATIQGDGGVAMILDVVGISQQLGLTAAATDDTAEPVATAADGDPLSESESLLLVGVADQVFALHLELALRVERIRRRQIEVRNGRMSMQYRGGHLRLFPVADATSAALARADGGEDHVFVVVFPVAGREAGLIVDAVDDVAHGAYAIDDAAFSQPGILGATIIGGRTTHVLDLYGLVRAAEPEWIRRHEASLRSVTGARVLIVEDTAFYRTQLERTLREGGYEPTLAVDGQQGLEILQRSPGEISLVVTDIEMPRMNGLELTTRIRADRTLAHLPVIAVTTLSEEEDRRRGLEAGVDEYLAKFDRERILAAARRCLNGRATGAAA